MRVLSDDSGTCESFPSFYRHHRVTFIHIHYSHGECTNITHVLITIRGKCDAFTKHDTNKHWFNSIDQPFVSDGFHKVLG